MSREHPLVSIVTPVYNGEKYLSECIESVLSQTYPNWDYTIVNNCSSDKTLEIAQRYADRDSRIRVLTNPEFVGLMENHNVAVSQISDRSEYCKVVSADDWLYPECIAKLVDLATLNPGVGIVGSYAINVSGVRQIGLPHNVSVFSGRHVCRLFLLGAVDAFGTPSTVLYRSSLVRASNPFYPGTAPSGDLAACLTYLRSSDFGFVHQILSFERIHSEAMNTKLRDLNSFLPDRLDFLEEYGHIYLRPDEVRHRMHELLQEYYRFLAAGVLNLRSREFREYHRKKIGRAHV